MTNPYPGRKLGRNDTILTRLAAYPSKKLDPNATQAYQFISVEKLIIWPMNLRAELGKLSPRANEIFIHTYLPLRQLPFPSMLSLSAWLARQVVVGE